MKARILFTAAVVFALNSTVMANTAYVSSNTYRNINGDFSSVESYHYSSDDTDNTKHTLVFCIDSDIIYADGKKIRIDGAPYISDGRTMLPLRAIIETFNTFSNDVNIIWDSQSKQVRACFQDNTAIFTIGSDEYELNGVRRKINGGIPAIKNERTFVPLRLISESMGLNVSWNAENRTVTITSE